jgi:hypothetical protein
MQVIFHATDLNRKCLGEHQTPIERIFDPRDHTIIGQLTINHGTIPGINDMVAVNFKGEKEYAKIVERAFDFETNTCDVWCEIIDMEPKHDGTVPYALRK